LRRVEVFFSQKFTTSFACAFASAHLLQVSELEKNKLHITVVAGRNLPAADLNGKSDPYVVIKDVEGTRLWH
jgi:Ca2+-dependent lipid-binding protein